MSSLYILGSGCSKNYDPPTKPIPGLTSPMNSDFFRNAKLVIENTGIKSNREFMDEIRNLIQTIAPMYGSKDRTLAFMDNPDLGLEQVMTLLDIDFKMFSKTSSASEAESRQLHVLKDLLAWTLDYALQGPRCPKHRTLAGDIKAHDIVLSFNYDILIDNALYDARKISDSSYRMDFFKVDDNGKWKRPNDETSDVALLKLHGSLNWVRCLVCNSVLLYRYKKQIMLGAMKFQCPRCSSESGQRMMIPPIQSKGYDPDISYLWIAADRLLRDIKRIICIGYSFPLTDFDMISLMRRFRARNEGRPEVVLVSPDDAVESRVKTLFGVEKVVRFLDLLGYLKAIKN